MDSQARTSGSFLWKTKKSTHFWADFWRYMKKKSFRMLLVYLLKHQERENEVRPLWVLVFH